MIEATDLSRRYGDYLAVDDVSFAVDEGEIVGILGPNGAGKTTTLRMITGFLPPSSGRIMVNGKDLLDDPVTARRDLGYLPEQVALYPDMRVSEYLAYRARLEGLGGSGGRRIDDVVERCLLDDVRDQIIGTLSKGYRQRVGLATAILHEPKVLVLDEPTVGLDPGQIIAIRELILDLSRESTLLLSTHILPEVELLCDRVMIIDRGRIVAQGTPSALRQRWMGNTEVRLELKDRVPGAVDVLGALDGVTAVRPLDDTATRIGIECDGDSDPREAIFHAAVENGWVLLELTESKASLEDIFVRLTTRDQAADALSGAAGEESS